MKNSSKSLLVVLCATVLALPSLWAQDNPAGGPPGGHQKMNRQQMADKMADELGLSADQRAKMKEINQAQRGEMEALRANTALSQEDQRAQMDTIRKSFMEKRHALMTPAQREKALGMRMKAQKAYGEKRQNKGERQAKPAEQK